MQDLRFKDMTHDDRNRDTAKIKQTKPNVEQSYIFMVYLQHCLQSNEVLSSSGSNPKLKQGQRTKLPAESVSCVPDTDYDVPGI